MIDLAKAIQAAAAAGRVHGLNQATFLLDPEDYARLEEQLGYTHIGETLILLTCNGPTLVGKRA